MPDSMITAGLLARWLYQCGSLTKGDVTDMIIERELETSVSRLIFLAASYSAAATPQLPQKLIVKSLLRPASPRDDRVGEVPFYQQVAPAIGTPPLVRCLAAIADSDGFTDTIVLEDLSATHVHPPWPLPPHRELCERVLDALIKVHASWWEAPTLGSTIGRAHTHADLTEMVHGIATHIPAFLDFCGDRMSRKARGIYEKVFGSSLKPWLRLLDPHALTIIHGDAHAWNFLLPDTGSGPAFLIDWQLWHIDAGARELAFLFALHWSADQRRELELPLLGYYHDGLVARGVINYSFEDLWLDYRRSAVRNLTMPIIFWLRGHAPEAVWHSLDCALAAYHDLSCDELL